MTPCSLSISPTHSAKMNSDNYILNMHRVDLYISCYAESLLPNRKTVKEFVITFREALSQHAESLSAIPSIFCPSLDLRGNWLEQRTRALIQTRGGGIALCLFTKDYFQDRNSIAELRCILNLLNSNDFSILFYSLDRPKKQLLQDLRQLSFLSNPEFYSLSTLNVQDFGRGVRRLDEDVWKFWDGSDSDSSKYGTRKYALGKSRIETFSSLRNAYTDSDLPFLCDAFEVQAGLVHVSLPYVFHAGLEKRFVSYHDMSCLRTVANQVPQPRAERQRAAIRGFEVKWIETNELEWSREEHDNLINLFKKYAASITASTSGYDSDNNSLSRRFRASFNGEADNGTTILNFNGEADHGTAILDYDNTDTVESQLKTELLSEGDHSFPIIVACGMIGVGKSVALRGLESLLDVKRKFKDGVLRIKLGRNSSLLDLTKKIEGFLRKSGGDYEADRISTGEDFELTIRVAHEWFQGKNCLFLIDDIWFRNGITVEKIKCLSGVCGNENSRICITTRDTRLLMDGGSCFRCVIFRPQDPYGQRASDILLRGARELRPPLDTDEFDAYEKILRVCNGLPLMLASAGKTIQHLKSRNPNAKNVWRASAREVSLKCFKKSIHFFFQYLDNTSELMESTDTALEMIEKDLKIGCCKRHFESFCVVQQEHSIPISLLERLWKAEHHIEDLITGFGRFFLVEDIPCASVDEKEMKMHEITLLAVRNMSENSNQRLEFSRSLIAIYLLKVRHIRNRKERILKRLYSLRYRLLPYVPERFQSVVVRGFGTFDKKFLRVEDDGYIFKHVCHLLRGSTWIESLMNLLSNPKWIVKQLTTSGLEQNGADTTQAQDEFETNQNALEKETRINASHFLSALRDACKFSVQESDGEEHILWSQLYGRMIWMRNNNFAKRFLSLFSVYAPKPWVVPSEGCFPAAGSALQQIVHFPGEFLSAQVVRNYLYVCYRDNDDDSIVKVKQSRCNDLENTVFPVICSQSVGDIKFVEFSEACDYLRIEFNSGFVEEHTILSNGILRKDSAGEAPHTPHSLLEQISSILRSLKFDVTDLYHDGTLKILSDDRGEAIILHRRGGRVINLLWKIWNDWRTKTLHDGCHVSKYVCISKNGKMIAYVVKENELLVWENLEGIWNLISLNGSDGRSLERHFGNISSICVSKKGDCIAAGSTDCTVRKWKMESKLCTIFRGHWKPVTYVSLAQNGKYVVSASSDCTVRRWISSEALTESVICGGHCCAVSSAFIHDNSELALSGSEDGSLCFWKRSELCWECENIGSHDGPVSCMNMSADGQYLISGGLDSTIRVWKKENRRWNVICIKRHSAPVTSVYLSTGGTIAISSSEDKTIKVCTWNGNFWSEDELWQCSDEQSIKNVSLIQCTDGPTKSVVEVSLENGPNLTSLTIPLKINDGAVPVDHIDFARQSLQIDKKRSSTSELQEETKEVLQSVVDKIYHFKTSEFNSGFALYLRSAPYFGFADIEE